MLVKIDNIKKCKVPRQ